MSTGKKGADTCDVEVVQIDEHGIWLHARGVEYFLPHTEYPWFREAKLDHVLNVQLLHGTHLYWPDLDVDLSLKILGEPEAYPLVYR